MWKRFIWIVCCLSFWLTPSVLAASPPALPSFDVLIDVGHGGVDSGAVHGSLEEKNINLSVAKLLYDELRKNGYNVMLNRTGDYALSEENKWLSSRSRHRKDLAQRKHLAIELPPKIMISIHVNYSSSPKPQGPVVLYQKNNQSFLLADMLQHHLNNVYQIRSRMPHKGKTYYILNQSICPTVIVELGFISNARDRHYLTTPRYQKQLAQAIHTAINEYFYVVGEMEHETHRHTLLEELIESVFRLLGKK